LLSYNIVTLSVVLYFLY